MFDKILNKFKDAEKMKPSAELVNGRISYKFQCGVEACQEELNLDQDERLTEIVLGFDMSSFSLDTSSIKDLLDLLVKEKSVTKILDIILLPVGDGKPDYSQLKNSELQNVLSDFFSLKSYGNKLVEDYRQRSDFLTSDPVYREFISEIEKESVGLPKTGYEDLIYILCGNDFSPGHEKKIKQMKLSKAGIIMVIKEKECFRAWRDRENGKNI